MSTHYGSFITACNKNPGVVSKDGAQNKPFISFKIKNDLGYDFDFKIISTSLHHSIDKFSSTELYSVLPGTILQLLNKDTKTVRQIVPLYSGQEISISQIPICTTVLVCDSPVFVPKEPLGFGVPSVQAYLHPLKYRDSNTRTHLEVLSYGTIDDGKSYGDYWKVLPSHRFDFSVFEIYRISELKYDDYNTRGPYQTKNQRVFKLLEPGIYDSLDIMESPNCTSHVANWGIQAVFQNQKALDLATSGCAKTVYIILLLSLTVLLMLHKRKSFTKHSIDTDLLEISKKEKKEKKEK